MQVDAYDFETTGLSPKSCEPVQLGLVTVDIGPDGTCVPIDSHSIYLRIIASRVPEGAQAIHGISKSTLELYGQPPQDVIPQIGPIVLGYNNHSYDDVIARRYGAQITQSIDMFVATRRLKSRGVLSRSNLSTAYTELTGQPPDGAHDALVDVNMTLALIRPVMEVKGFTEFTQLLTWVGSPEANIHMRMPFGRYKHRKLKDLPKSYVRWLLEEVTLTGDMKAGLEAL